jgi:glutamate formiminotransferase
MNSRQRRKVEAEDHNRKRIEAHVERVRIAQDKIDNPQKYARRSRMSAKKVMPFIALCAAAGFSI